jgi:hypothetical protein
LENANSLSAAVLVTSHDVYIHGLVSTVFRGDGDRFGLATSVANNGRTEAGRDLGSSAGGVSAVRISI